MTTSDDIKTILRLLDKRQTVPASMIRSIANRCEQLLTICNQQNARIRELEAKLEAQREEQ